jgi:hypothetical protein
MRRASANKSSASAQTACLLRCARASHAYMPYVHAMRVCHTCMLGVLHLHWQLAVGSWPRRGDAELMMSWDHLSQSRRVETTQHCVHAVGGKREGRSAGLDMLTSTKFVAAGG